MGNEGYVREIAKVCHEVNRAYCESMDDYSQPAWDDAPKWQKVSAIHGVKFQLENPDLSPEEIHENWYNEKKEAGWRYGPVKSVEHKEHPCMLPYQDLHLSQRAKDFIFKGVVQAIGKSKFCYADVDIAKGEKSE